MIPITDPEKIWELRLHLGDIGDLQLGEDQFISDEAYQYFINKYTTLEGVYYFKRALISSAMSILAIVKNGAARQRVGQEEIYGKELFDSWLAFLTLLQKNKYNGGGSPIVYAGGIYRDATEYYSTSPEFVDYSFYRGQQDRSPYWKYNREFPLNTVIEPEERKQNYTNLYQQ